MSEIAQKEEFRQCIELLCRDIISRHEQLDNNNFKFQPLSVDLKYFGSLSSGFATNASDMDLGLLSPMSEVPPDATDSPIPRLLEKAFLDAGLGARLLSRTRVPIIKLCQAPPESLRQALLAERERWEKGVANEVQEATVDEYPEPEAGRLHHVIADSDLNKDCGSVQPTDFEISCRDSGEARRFRLQQGSNHTLSAYYGLAKRILRRAGGRDVTISNRGEFTAVDWAILNRVCQAFITGLSDPMLRERVASLPSLSFKPLYNMPNDRSLLGVFTQVEGEQALQKWETWPIKDELYEYQPQAKQALSTWKNVQSRKNYGVDPIQYTKDLQMALDKIKRIPSVQLALLEQGQHETPSQYFLRTRDILTGLRYGSRKFSAIAQQEIIKRYISGIVQKDVRSCLGDEAANLNDKVDFEAVGIRHKALHLARQLESALQKGSLDEIQARDIADYVTILKSSPHRIYTGPFDFKAVIPIPRESIGLMMRIRDLQDIHDMDLSQSRDRHRDHLEFPTSGVGVQCDINFSAHLALHNTALLRCYSHTDSRVRPMVLFLKHWAKVRGINSGYRGTLSSYGYVLMVLHYLVNVVQPFVCPNLQHLAPRPTPNPSPAEIEATLCCRGYNVQFWRDERKILHLAAAERLNHNTDSIGSLLRGFFEYFACNGILSSGHGKGFDWGRDVLSIRTRGGLLTKLEKGWTGAKTVVEIQETRMTSNPLAEQVTDSSAGVEDGKQRIKPHKKGGDFKEIRHRYLFAINDPFELDHNVARTVTTVLCQYATSFAALGESSA